LGGEGRGEGSVCCLVEDKSLGTIKKKNDDDGMIQVIEVMGW
jgi:hypothetical protein